MLCWTRALSTTVQAQRVVLPEQTHEIASQSPVLLKPGLLIRVWPCHSTTTRQVVLVPDSRSKKREVCSVSMSASAQLSQPLSSRGMVDCASLRWERGKGQHPQSSSVTLTDQPC